MLKRKLGIIFGTMMIFSLISYILIAAFGRKTAAHGREEEMILTSFYPVFIITRNLTQDIEGVRVANLTENQTGCLHDYQLTTKDMLLLETADLLVINGGGMELFIEQATKKLSGLTVIDSCEGIELLVGGGHNHDHEGEMRDSEQSYMGEELGNYGQNDAEEKSKNPRQNQTEVESGSLGQNNVDRESKNSKQDQTEGESGSLGQNDVDGESKNSRHNQTEEESEKLSQNQTEEEVDENGHVWMAPERYLMQIHTIADGLCKALPEYETNIRANELSYSEKISTLAAEYADLKGQLSGLAVVTFHDAFAYLCDNLGIEVVHGLDLDADSALSAGELADLTDEIRLHGVRYLFAEKENIDIAEQVAKETGCNVLCLDPLTSGVDELNAYLDAMRQNLECLRGILH